MKRLIALSVLVVSGCYHVPISNSDHDAIRRVAVVVSTPEGGPGNGIIADLLRSKVVEQLGPGHSRWDVVAGGRNPAFSGGVVVGPAWPDGICEQAMRHGADAVLFLAPSGLAHANAGGIEVSLETTGHLLTCPDERIVWRDRYQAVMSSLGRGRTGQSSSNRLASSRSVGVSSVVEYRRGRINGQELQAALQETAVSFARSLNRN